ncbi:MAG: hypothetical protein CML81_02335 [Rhodobiaceae bacterium]|nr:hypothetical protein [Rhodobiaceae bacterium]RPF97236.1 MAG: DUF3035 domain-containing protein [Rhizobiales bacterium TMED227]
MVIFILTLKKIEFNYMNFNQNYLSKLLTLTLLCILPSCGSSLKEFVSTSYSGNAFQAGPPDEFLTITKKPLKMPPDYLLRPPNENQIMFIDEPMTNAKEAVLGSQNDSEVSDGEAFILQMAKAQDANPEIKRELYAEEGAFQDETLAEYLSRLKSENNEVLDPELESMELIKGSPTSNSEPISLIDDTVNVEGLSMNQFMLSNLQDGSSKSNENVNYDIRIEDGLGIDKPKEEINTTNELQGGSDFEQENNTEKEIPNVFNGLWGELSSGFGLF